MRKTIVRDIHVREPRREGDGTSRVWTRTFRNGKRYSFNAVTMPNGERRYFASRWDGPENGPNFACDWTRVFSFNVRAEYFAHKSVRFSRLYNVALTDVPDILHVGIVHRDGEYQFTAYRHGEILQATNLRGIEGTVSGKDEKLGTFGTLDAALAAFRSHWYQPYA